MDKEIVVDIYNKILFGPWKEQDLGICHSANEPGGHDAKWNKQPHRKKLLHNLICMWKFKYTDVKNKSVFIRIAEEKGEM